MIPKKKFANQNWLKEKEELFMAKKKKLYQLSEFFKEGNGLKGLLNYTGRLLDLKGIYFIVDQERSVLYIEESKHVLNDIQKFIRNKREKDNRIIKEIMQRKSFTDLNQAVEFLIECGVNWIEVNDKAERLLLKRSLMGEAKNSNKIS